MKTIKISEIKPFYILFSHGEKSLAKKIQWFQKLKYGEKNPFWFINHCGHFDFDYDRALLVYQEDNPGKYRAELFSEDYLKDKSDVYVGIPKIEIIDEMIKRLRHASEVLAGDERLLDYSYKSFIGFIWNAAYYRAFGREWWITGEPKKGATCSQREAKLYQMFGLFKEKNWYEYFPCDIANNEMIELRKLEY